jgi:subtilisin-like proprotein convertase family protein
MSDTSFFWQGGRKISIKKDDAQVTIQAPDTEAVEAMANRAGVRLRALEPVGPGMMRAEIEGDRDTSVDRLREEEVTHHVYRSTAHPEQEILITESFFIKFKPDTPEDRILAYFTAENLHVEKDMGNKTFLVRVTDDTGRNPIRTANAALSRGDVEYAEPNLVRTLSRFAFIPPDPGFAKQWHLHSPADVAPNLVRGAGIFAPEAWDLTRGRRDIVVAVADDGFDLTHPDFVGTGKVAAQLNATPVSNGLIQWDSDVSPRSGDYHGTPCLGVAVAEGNGTGVVGVAPGCALVAVRFPLSMSDAHFVTMFQKISAIADVVSCSWGVGPADAGMSTAFKDAISQLARTGGRRGKGLVICVAAGNNNCPVKDLANTQVYRYLDHNDIIRSYRGPIDRWIAAHPDVCTISASTSRKTRSAYSSWGNEICVCAPSDNWDDLGQSSPPGLGIMTTDNEGFGSGSEFTINSRFTNHFGGTSSATPTVAGVCGLILSQNATLSAADVRKILQDTADKDLVIFSDTPVNSNGAFVGGRSPWFGSGKVNAFKAVQAAAPASQTLDLNKSVNANLQIPDAGAAVESSLLVNRQGKVADVRVTVNVKHTYIGDLRIDLIAPDGTAVILHNHSGGSSDDLRKTYTAVEVPALRTLDGKSASGSWKLRVRDTAHIDEGQLKSWRLAAHLIAPAPATSSLARNNKTVANLPKRRGRRTA